jgi:hypothetical protein
MRNKGNIRSCSEGNAILSRYELGQDAIGEAIAGGPDGHRPGVDYLLQREFQGPGDACGSRRTVRVWARWPDGAEAHEATCRLEYRWEGSRKWVGC